jgi:DNA-binding FadR family transcriptional regulator
MVTIQRFGELNPVQAVKLSDQVTRAVARRIVNGEIGGTAPPPTEQDICREFEVSKTTAREVVQALAGLGLVEVRHGRRMRVRPVEEWNHLDPLLLELNDNPEVVRRYLADLHDVRMLLEPEIAARAALRATAAHVDRLRATVERMAALVNEPDTYLEVDLAFHRELAAATDNVVLGFLLDSVRELLRVSRRVTNLTGALAEATRAHRQILDAVAAGEAETARQAMRAHLLTVTSVWVPGEQRAELRAAIGRGKERETEAING